MRFHAAVLSIALLSLQGCLTCAVWGLEPPRIDDVFSDEDTWFVHGIGTLRIREAIRASDGSFHLLAEDSNGVPQHLSAGPHRGPVESWPRAGSPESLPILDYDLHPMPAGAPLHGTARSDAALTALLGQQPRTSVALDGGLVVLVGEDGDRRPIARLPARAHFPAAARARDANASALATAGRVLATPFAVVGDVVVLVGVGIVVVVVGPVAIVADLASGTPPVDSR